MTFDHEDHFGMRLNKVIPKGKLQTEIDHLIVTKSKILKVRN